MNQARTVQRGNSITQPVFRKQVQVPGELHIIVHLENGRCWEVRPALQTWLPIPQAALAKPAPISTMEEALGTT